MTNYSPLARKKILHIISGDLWAGAEAQTHSLLQHLKLQCAVSAVLMNEGELANRLRACDIPVTILDETKLTTWKIFQRLRTHMRLLKPDVVHTHRQKENILGALANATTVKAFCVRTVHGAPEGKSHFKIDIQRHLERWVTTKLQDRVIAVSDELKEKLSTDYPINMIDVIYNGVDIEELNARARIADFKLEQPHKKHIGIIGRLVKVKRIDLFLATAALFKEDANPGYHFHVIGEGPLRQHLETMAKHMAIDEIVTFHGQRHDIPSCILSLDAVVMCSDHEGMPMVALESAALNTIFITHLAHLEKITNQPPIQKSPQDFAQAIRHQPSKAASPPKASSCSSQTFELYSRNI